MERTNRSPYKRRLRRIVGESIGLAVAAFRLRRKIQPSIWAADNINFRYVKSARIRGKIDLSLTPYLVPVIDAWDFKGTRREITVCAPEQTGKTLAWLIGLLWTFIFEWCLSLVCYESDDKAEEINTEKFLPLMKAIPEFAAELNVPKSKRKDKYKFSNITSLFQGSGSRITSVSARIAIADELDDWQEHEGQVENLDDMRKRTRSFPDSMLAKVCTVKGSDPSDKNAAGLKPSKIWREFLNSSQGYWHLRCQGCGKLTLRSCDVKNLKFKRYTSGDLIPGSCRLVCPKCGYAHTEKQKLKMNQQGDYIHKRPERLQGKEPNYGFQWGALASAWESLNWNAIAKAAIKGGKKGQLKNRVYFANSIQGLPFKLDVVDAAERNVLLKHCAPAPPDPETIEGVFVTVDTQKTCWKWEARALDINSNRYQLSYGFCEYPSITPEFREAINEKRRQEAIQKGHKFSEVKTLEDILNDEYCSHKPLLMMIDEGGNRKKEVNAFVQEHDNVISYKGDNRGLAAWRWSKEQSKLLLCKASEYQSNLLYLLYAQRNKEFDYWYLLPQNKLTNSYLDEVAAMQKALTPDGHLFENYTHSGRTHDYFDTGKMYLALEEMAIAELAPSSWQHGKAKILGLGDQDRDRDQEPEAEKESGQDSAAYSESWMSGY